MRKFILMAFAGLAIMVALPQTGSASPLMPAAGLAVAADDVALTQDVRWHRHWHHRHWGWRHRHHWRHWGWRHHHRHWRHYGWRHHRWHHRRHWARW
jgi:hypothetical protein